MLVLDQRVLRRLDRIDCVVLHPDLLRRRQFVIGGVFADDPEDIHEARAHIEQLFNAKRPLEVQTDGKAAEEIVAEIKAYLLALQALRSSRR